MNRFFHGCTTRCLIAAIAVALGGLTTAAKAQVAATLTTASAQSGGSPTETPSRQPDPSTSLTVTVDGRSIQLSEANLSAMQQTTVSVRNGHTHAQESYSGVALADLLAKVGVAADGKTRQRILHSYLRAQGTDFYFVLYSGTEVESSMHDGTVIVALRKGGRRLGSDGPFRLVSSGDTVPARWVHNLASLTLVTVN